MYTKEVKENSIGAKNKSNCRLCLTLSFMSSKSNFHVSPPPALARKTTKFYLYKASKMLFKAQTRLFAQAACKNVFPFKARK